MDFPGYMIGIAQRMILNYIFKPHHCAMCTVQSEKELFIRRRRRRSWRLITSKRYML